MAGFKRFVEAYERREHVFYMDECVFSCGQVKPKVWFHALSGPVVRAKKKVGFKAIAVAGAIDHTGKVVAHLLRERSIEANAFMEFLHRLKDHIGRKKAVLLLDNLGVHRTKAVRELAPKLGIELVFNGTYSSNFMPIERLWGWAKHHFTRACAKDAPYHD